MRILWITENFFPSKGGMAQSCDRIVHQLRKLGISIDVLHLSQRTNTLRIAQVQNGQNIAFPIEKDLPHSLNLVWLFLEQQSQKVNYTHLVAFGGYLPIMASPIYTTWLQLPLITFIRGNDFDTAIFTVKRREILRDAFQKSSAICTVTKEKAVKIKNLFPEKKVFFTPNGIDLSAWESTDLDKKQAEKWRSQNLKTGQKVMGIFGQLKAKKGVLFLLKTIKAAALQEKIHLIIVGDISEEVQEYLSANQEIFHYTHHQFMERFQLIPHYLACDVIAIPSFYDGMPNVLLEGGGLAKAMITSRVGGMKDVLTGTDYAFLFEANNWQSCKEALYDFMNTDAKILKEKGEKIKQHIQENYSQEKEAKTYQEIFKKISENQK